MTSQRFAALVGLVILLTTCGCVDPASKRSQDAMLSGQTVHGEVLYNVFTGRTWELRLLYLPSRLTKVVAGSSDTRQFGLVGGESAALSPDGGRVLFNAVGPSRTTDYSQDGNDLTDLWIVRKDGSRLRRFTKDAQGYSSLKWSPDGRYVSAYSGRRWATPDLPPTESMQRRYDLDVWEISTGRRWRVASDVQEYQWSPDGRRLAVVSRKGEYNSYFVLLTWDARTHQRHILARDAGICSWLPDGSGLLIEKTEGGIMLVPAGGGTPKPYLPTVHSLRRSSLSPDRSMLAFGTGSDTLILRLGDRSVRMIDKQGIASMWSPDSRKLAGWLTDTTVGNAPYSTQIYEADADSGAIRILGEMTDDAEVLGWTPDSGGVIVLHMPKARSSQRPGGDMSPLPCRLMLVPAVGGNACELAALPRYGVLREWRLLGK